MADPLSVLGAAVGVTSLIIQITDECIKGYQYYIRAVNMPEEYRYCRVRLQMEQQRFLNFGLAAGVLYADGDLCATLRVKRSLLLAVLAEIKTLLEQYAAANGKYVDYLPQTDVEWGDQQEPETDLTAMLYLPPDNLAHADAAVSSDSNQQKYQRFKQLRKVAKGIVQTGRNLRTVALEPKRLVWAAIDKEGFERVIARLADLNSFLIALLDNAQIEMLQLTMDTSYSEILQIRNDITSLTELVKALGTDAEKRRGDELLRAATLDGNPLGQVFSQQTEAQGKRNSYLRKLTEVKLQYQRIGDGDQMDLNTVLSAREPLDISHFAFDPNEDPFSRNRTYAVYKGHKPVWIEWKPNPPFQQFNAHAATSRAEHRIRLLTDLLCDEIPDEFRSPPCLGYVKRPGTGTGTEDAFTPTQFGIVFENPPSSSSSTVLSTSPQCVTLHELLQQRPKPSLSARITLCAALTECVYSFHTVNWLHKGLRSENVVFFFSSSSSSSSNPHPHPPNKPKPNLTTPYVLGYELSRPSILDELTEKPEFKPSEDIYRHPFAQSSQSSGNYRRSYDLYSLGILLIEIASWKPIQAFLGIADVAVAKPVDLLGVQRRLLDDEDDDDDDDDGDEGGYLERVGSVLGDVYREVVELCLRADEVERPVYEGEPEVSVAVRLQRVLGQDIVRKLKDMERVMKMK